MLDAQAGCGAAVLAVRPLDRLRAQGWQVAAYTLPLDLQEKALMRALVRRGFTRRMANRLLDDLRSALAWFEKHPMERPSSADQGSSDPHGGVHPSSDTHGL